MKEIEEKVKQELDKSYTLRNLDLSAIPFDKAMEIRKEQEKTYNKYMFFKELNEVMNRKGKDVINKN